MTKVFLTIFTLLLATSSFSQTKSSAALDAEGVLQACFNYIDAFYKVDTTLAYQSVHPTLQKRGFYFDEKINTYSHQVEMPFPALIRLAKVWNKDGKRVNEKSPRQVQILK